MPGCRGHEVQGPGRGLGRPVAGGPPRCHSAFQSTHRVDLAARNWAGKGIDEGQVVNG